MTRSMPPRRLQPGNERATFMTYLALQSSSSSA
jgi:hypothetical protein